MKLNTRKRFFRAFVSSILASEMTEMELMEMLNELSYNPELNQEIKRGIKSALDILAKSSATEDHFMQHQDEPYDVMYEIIKKRRLSKNSVYEIIRMVIGDRTSKYISENQTMREILASFYSFSSKREQERFIELLGYSSGKDDSFLQGIIRDR